MGDCETNVPQRRAARRIAIATVCSALLATSGCTAVTWRGDDGTLHHLGLVAVHQDAHDLGVAVHRYALGLDLNLSGWWPGYTLGVSGSTAIQPALLAYEPGGLGPSVTHLLTHGELAEPAPPGAAADDRWGLFYFADRRSQHASVVETWMVGAQLAYRPAVTDLTWGWRATRDLTPLALQRDTAHIRMTTAEGSDVAVLWLPARAAASGDLPARSDAQDSPSGGTGP
jgi:hypothetical protein